MGRSKNITISIGRVTIEVKPISLESSFRLFLLMAPHVGRVERYWPHLRKAAGNGALLEVLLKELAKELQFAPGDIVTAYSILLDLPPEWIAVNASAKELIEALPALDSVNDFRGLWAACESLGIVD